MADFDAGAFMKDIINGLMTVAESVKIIGEPVTVGDRVVIPAVVARVGFGAGGGSGRAHGQGGDEDKEGSAEGSGGGGGGGAIMTPVFLIVDGQGERLLTVPSGFERAGTLVEKAREALERVARSKEGVAEELEEDEELRDLGGGSGPAH